MSALEPDYDTNPDRFRTAMRTVELFGVAGDVHRPIAHRFRDAGARAVLDIGCGDGRLLRELRSLGIATVGLDRSEILLADAPAPVVRADACSVPFGDGTFDAAAAVYMLYHLVDPLQAIAEAHRVLRPNGLFAAAAPSRFDSPETSEWESFAPSTFDAELAPELVGQIFGDIQVEVWDGPLIRLPDRRALGQYLVGRGMSADRARQLTDGVRAKWPLMVTKRGSLVYGRKRPRAGRDSADLGRP